MSISKILCNADRILKKYSLLEYLGAFILEPVSDMIMADICNNITLMYHVCDYPTYMF